MTATAAQLVPAPPRQDLHTPAQGRYLELDALRGLAAVAVMLFHYEGYLTHHWKTSLWSPLSFGHYGVQLFFIISGFVILMSARRARSVWGFAVSRFARLYPAYWTACALIYTLLVFFTDPGPSVVNAQLNLPMIEIAGVERLENVFWTLQQEVWFYVVIAALIALRRLDLAFWPVAVLTVTSLAGLRFTRWFGLFLLGMVLYDSLKGLRPRHYALLALVAADILSRSLYRRTIDVVGWEYPLAVLVCAGLVVLGTRARLPWLTNPFLLFLGMISYSLYLVHATVGAVVLARLRGVAPAWLAVLVSVGLSLLAAVLITFLIERPAMRAIRSRMARGAV